MHVERNLNDSGTFKVKLESVIDIETSDEEFDCKPVKRLTKSMNLEEYDELLEREGIDLEILSEMDHTELKSIGVKRFGDRHRLLREAKKQIS